MRNWPCYHGKGGNMTTALHPQRNGHAIVMYQCTDTLELGENWNTATSPNAIKLFAHTKLANNVEVCTTSNIFKCAIWTRPTWLLIFLMSYGWRGSSVMWSSKLMGLSSKLIRISCVHSAPISGKNLCPFRNG